MNDAQRNNAKGNLTSLSYFIRLKNYAGTNTPAYLAAESVKAPGLTL
jgi:hypothetical protein